jgi:predicted GNAT family acetyltransferase
MVQIGGVFTPHALRGKGYARACVAGSLLAARTGGVRRAVLFTPKTNNSAQAAYRAIGFQVVGEYGLTIFR